MERSEASKLFLKYAKLKTVLGDTEREVVAIVNELGCLALAVTLAGSYVSSTPRISSDIRQYLPEYHQRRKQLLEQKPKTLVHHYGESVLTTWETSMTAITSQNAVACRLLTLLAFLHYDDIFLELFFSSDKNASESKNEALQSILSIDKSVDTYDIEAAFRKLQSYSLLQWNSDQNSYSMHKLVHAWTHDRLILEEQKRFGASTLRLSAQIISDCKPNPFDRSRLVPHLMANFTVVSTAFHDLERDDEILSFLSPISDFLDKTGRYADVVKLRSFQLIKWDQILGGEHPQTFIAMSNLAVTLRMLRKLDEAVSIQKEILEKMKKTFGDEDPQTFIVMSNLAVTLKKLGMLDEAVSMQMEVVEKMRRIIGDQSLETFTAMNNLACSLVKLGKVNEAVSMQKEVVEKTKSTLGHEHPQTFRVTNNLSVTLKTLGKLDEAASMQKELVEKMERILGDEHPDTITAMRNYTVTLEQQAKSNDRVSS